jgi:multimeric flavodoxin WrbA
MNKKVEIFIGSPRKNGNTSFLSAMMAKTLERSGVACGITRLYEYNIKPCTDCRSCKTGDLECPVNDDMQALYRKMEEAGVLIFATPVYWYSVTATMKLLIDRLRPCFKNRRLAGKKAALLLPAGSGEGDCDLTSAMFRRIFETLGIKYCGALCVEAYDEGDLEGRPDLVGIVDDLILKLSLAR